MMMMMMMITMKIIMYFLQPKDLKHNRHQGWPINYNDDDDDNDKDDDDDDDVVYLIVAKFCQVQVSLATFIKDYLILVKFS